MGKPKDPDYWKKWRAAHPDYRKKEVKRKKEKRQTLGREDRSTEYKNQTKKRQVQRMYRDGENGTLVASHPIMDLAIEVADKSIRKDHRTSVADFHWEEAVCVAGLAIVEGEDPYEAVARYKKYVNDFKYNCRTGESWDTFLTVDTVLVESGDGDGSGIYNATLDVAKHTRGAL